MCNTITSWLIGVLFTVVFGFLVANIYKKRGMSLRFWLECFFLIIGVMLAFKVIAPTILHSVFHDINLSEFFPWCLYKNSH